MSKSRIEAFSDGVLAIIITIMVLELKVPQDTSLAAIKGLTPTLLSYLLSFYYLGIYWNNHHHLFQAIDRVSGGILWANLLLLFFLSLVPFATAWMGEHHFAPWPVAFYGLILMLAGVAYYILERALISLHGKNSDLGKAVGSDYKGLVSVLIYALAIALAFWQPWIACALYVLVSLLWLIPDRRIEKQLTE